MSSMFVPANSTIADSTDATGDPTGEDYPWTMGPPSPKGYRAETDDADPAGRVPTCATGKPAVTYHLSTELLPGVIRPVS